MYFQLIFDVELFMTIYTFKWGISPFPNLIHMFQTIRKKSMSEKCTSVDAF